MPEGEFAGHLAGFEAVFRQFVRCQAAPPTPWLLDDGSGFHFDQRLIAIFERRSELVMHFKSPRPTERELQGRSLRRDARRQVIHQLFSPFTGVRLLELPFEPLPVEQPELFDVLIARDAGIDQRLQLGEDRLGMHGGGEFHGHRPRVER